MTEAKVRSLNASDIVEWIHRLEDENKESEEIISELEDELQEAEAAVKLYKRY